MSAQVHGDSVVVLLISGMCFMFSPGALRWRAGQQGVQRFGCSRDRRPQFEPGLKANK